MVTSSSLFDLPSDWKNAVAVTELMSLEGIYHELDSQTGIWNRASGLSCPSGCGSCCTRFTPDILPVEAEYLAYYLLGFSPGVFDLPGLKDRNTSQDDQCPLYATSAPFHCTVYQARPLVCRLFGFSGVRGKDGLRHFSPCRDMPLSDTYRKLLEISGTGRSREIAVPDDFGLPGMHLFGSGVEGIRSSDAAVRRLLPEAVFEAAARIRLRRQLADSVLLSGRESPDDSDPFNSGPGNGFPGSDSA